MKHIPPSCGTPLDEVERLARNYRDIPLEAIAKEDLLRLGMAWSGAALEIIAASDSDSRAYTVTGGSITSALEGLSEVEFYMSRGITPQFTTWCPEPLSMPGRTQGGAPLEYYVRLLRTYRETHARYGLPAPRGYGEPGIGRAVFSVSVFMHVLAPASEPHARTSRS